MTTQQDLVPVHGGLSEPVDRTVPLKVRKRFLAEASGLPCLRVTRADLSTVYRIADGTLQDSSEQDALGTLQQPDSSRSHADDLLALCVERRMPVQTLALASLLGRTFLRFLYTRAAFC